MKLGKKGAANIGLILIALVIASAVKTGKLDLTKLNLQSILGGMLTVNIQQPQVPFQPQQPQDYGYSLSISVTPASLCVGEPLTGTIRSNMMNGVCTIFVDPGTGWQVWNNVNLDGNGGYAHTEAIHVAGTATFRAVCQLGGNYRISNDVTITVNPCATTTTAPAKGDWKCCQYLKLWKTCRYKLCNKGEFEAGSYRTELECKLNCKGTSPTTTTIPVTTTTTSSVIYCTASYPMPRSQKDCTYRYGCSKLEACIYYYDLKQGSHCECTSKYTTTTTTYTATTTTRTTTTTTVAPPPDCQGLCLAMQYNRNGYLSNGWTSSECYSYGDDICWSYGGIYAWQVASDSRCCCFICGNPV